MALTPIPNQPYVFSTDDQQCLNNDPVQYRQIVHPGDEIKIQLINEPCGGELLCEPTANIAGENVISNGTFDSGTDWTLLSMNATISGGKLNLNVISGSSQSHASQVDIPDASTCGATFYLWSITFSNVTGSPLVLITGSAPGSSTTIYGAVPENGTVTGWYVGEGNGTGTFDINISTVDTGTGTVSIDDISFIPYNTDCWCLEDRDSSWTFDVVNNYGEFTHTGGGNTQYFGALMIPAGFGLETYRIRFKIKNRTAGSITPYIEGTEACPSTSSNGQYDEVVTVGPGFGGFIVFTPTSDFDGTLYDFSVTHTNTSHLWDIVRIDQGISEVVTDAVAGTNTNDRFDVIIDTSALIFEGESTSLVEGGCYRIRVYDGCTDDEEPSLVTSTVFAYGETDCTVLVEASCDTEGLGFDFSGDFTLLQRLKLLRFGTFHSNKGTDADGSDGNKRNAFRKSQKIYKCVFNYVDEFTHDAINAQINCDNLTLDGVEYFAPVQDYEPDWIGRGKYNLAQSEIELQKKNSVIYNRNNI